MKLIDEIMYRNSMDSQVFKIIGTEIRMRRKKKSLTLEALCENVCSISYLSKIENNEIKANPLFLEEISSRVNLDRDTLNTLMESRKLFKEVVIAFYRRDNNLIHEICAEFHSMNNYRIYFIFFY